MDDLSDDEYKAAVSEFQQIQELVDAGVLGAEDCPTPNYWHWPVLQPDMLPMHFAEGHETWGEVRYYGRMREI